MKTVQAKDKSHLQKLIKQAFDKGIHDLNFIDTSQVTDMHHLFYGIEHDFEISKWDVSQVTNMDYMFFSCQSFDQDLSQWDVSQVTNMGGMFVGCNSFNQDLSQWDVSQVTNMGSMFFQCESFNQDLSQWDVSQVTYMGSMFLGCVSFNQDLSQWDVSRVSDMSGMFSLCHSFDQDLSMWDVSRVTDMYCMFGATIKFDHDHTPQAFYQKENIPLRIELDQGIKDLIDTLDHTNLELALNLANNIDKLQETRHYINKAIVDGFLFGKFEEKEGEAYKVKAEHIIQSL